MPEGSQGTIALCSAAWSCHVQVTYHKPREPPHPTWLSACQALKHSTRDFQLHYPGASHRFHFLWSDKSKEGESEIYSHGLVITQACEITTRRHILVPGYVFPLYALPHGS